MVAKVAEQLFGKPFKPEAVVRETLEVKFPGAPQTDSLEAAVAAPVNMNAPETALLVHSTAAWLEACNNGRSGSPRTW